MEDFEKESTEIIGGRGGRRQGSGRPQGSLNRNTALVKEMAGEFNEAAIKTLAHLMLHGDTHQVKLAASIALLNRSSGIPRHEEVQKKEIIVSVNR